MYTNGTVDCRVHVVPVVATVITHNPMTNNKILI